MPFLKFELGEDPEAQHERANNSIPLLSGNEPSLEPLVDEDEDGNINLWRVFFHLLQESKSQWPDSIGNFIDPTPNEALPRRFVDFNRPVKEQLIKCHLRRCLNTYLAYRERPLGSPVPQAEMCYVWASVTFHGRVLGDIRESFKVTSSACVQANSTRKSSYVQFLQGETIASGEVSLFFTVEHYGMRYLAYVQNWELEYDGEFITKKCTGPYKVIDALMLIKTLVGLVQRGSNLYIVFGNRPATRDA